MGRLVKTPRRENLGTWTRGSDRVLPSPHGWAPGARTHPPAAAKAPAGCWERRTLLVMTAFRSQHHTCHCRHQTLI